MNLLLINYEYPPIGGGAGNATMFIARALHQMGHGVTVLTSAYAESNGIADESGVRVHRLDVMRRRADRASAHEMLSFLLNALRAAPSIAVDRAIDAVIVFFTLPCGPVALKLYRTMRIPYVISLRGGDVPGLVPEISLRHWLLTPVRRRVLRSAQAIVANDDGLACLSSLADPFPVTVIPNGVDCGFYRTHSKLKPSCEPTTVLFVGRFHRQKNMPFLLEQMARVRLNARDGWRLSLVGDGDERASLEQCVRRLGLTDITTWHGWQKDKEKLLGLYQQADVVVNPSLYEGMPNVLLEAMACSLPVVASAVPGNNSLVHPGRTGFLFSLGDGEALCAALQQIHEKPALARTLGDNGRRLVEEAFSWDRVARSYLDLFNR